VAGLAVAWPRLIDRNGGRESTGSGPGPSAAPSPAATEPALPSGCKLSQLPTNLSSGGNGVTVVAGEPTGRYLLGGIDGDKPATWLWDLLDTGNSRRVSFPGDFSEPVGVNSAGLVVANVSVNGRNAGYTYTVEGGSRRLAGATTNRVVAVNESGQFLGVDTANGSALLWRSPTSTPVKLLPPQGGKVIDVRDLDDDGTVIGTVDEQPYYWPGGESATPLPVPQGERFDVVPRHIRNGWIVGQILTKDDSRPGILRWHLAANGSAGADVKELAGPALASSTVGINGDGWIVGTDGTHAVLTTPTGHSMILPDPSNSATTYGALTISDNRGGPIVIGGHVTLRGKDYFSPMSWVCE
jgi:hypothetical protein